jgi:predicted transposase YdaD
MPSRQIPHDAAYKSFFSDKDMVTSLFQDFVPEDFVRDIDFTTLELIPTNHVTKELRQRHDDIIWRVRWKDTYCYLYLLMEFQSTIDPFMAVRVLVYSGLLWEDLIATGVIKQGDKLPPIFPLVLYNGEQKWAAPQNVSELLTDIPSGLKIYQPSQQFFLIDQLALSDTSVSNAKGISASLIRLERARDIDSLMPLVGNLDSELKNCSKSLYVKFNTWLLDVIIKRAGIVDKIPDATNFMGVKTMLAERAAKWKNEYIQEGVLKGIAEGRAEGRAEGLADLCDTLSSILEDRFRTIPDGITANISKLDGSSLNELIRSVYRVKDMPEFVALLNTKLEAKK